METNKLKEFRKVCSEFMLRFIGPSYYDMNPKAKKKFDECTSKYVRMVVENGKIPNVRICTLPSIYMLVDLLNSMCHFANTTKEKFGDKEFSEDALFYGGGHQFSYTMYANLDDEAILNLGHAFIKKLSDGKYHVVPFEDIMEIDWDVDEYANIHNAVDCAYNLFVINKIRERRKPLIAGMNEKGEVIYDMNEMTWVVSMLRIVFSRSSSHSDIEFQRNFFDMRPEEIKFELSLHTEVAKWLEEYRKERNELQIFNEKYKEEFSKCAHLLK